MAKRIRIVFLIALTYFLIIIPVQSQQYTWEELIIEDFASTWVASGYETTQLYPWSEIIKSGSNDSWQNIQIEENLSWSTTWSEQIENIAENNFIDDTTSEIVQINQVPQIIISEIYYDGLDEWIEITNVWSGFSGELELQNPQSIFFPVSLKQDQSIILTKSSRTYDYISPIVIQQPLPLSFSFTDTKAIFTTLWRSGQLIDIFEAETGLINQYNDKKTSLIKKNIDQNWIITGENIDINVLFPYIASPGFFDFSEETQTGDQNWQTWTNDTISSWSDLGGEGMTGIVDIPTPTSPQPGILSITEIYQSNWLLSDFIELKALQNFSGKVFLSGSLLKTVLELDLFLEDQERIIIVYFDNWWLSDQKKIENTSLELNTSWYLQILGQSWQVFDTIQILSTSWNKSNYHWDFSNWNIDIFSKIDDFSPWFDEQFLVYFTLINSYTIWKNEQNTWYFDQIGSGEVSNENTQNWQNLSWILSWDIIVNTKDLQITNLNHLTPESITIKSNREFSLDLSQKDRYLLSKETPMSQRKSTKKYLTGILNSGESITISKTRWFLNAWSCIALFYQTGQIDQRCYGSALAQETIQEQEPQIENEPESIPNITILWVLPNPIGKDNQEELHLLRTWSVIANSSVIIQSNNLIIPSKSLYLKTNSTKKYLTGTFSKDKEKIFIDSLWLVNKPVCTELRYKTTLLDTYCYPQPQEGQYLEKSDVSLSGTEENVKYIPKIHIQWLLPNPKGKDDQELISLFRNTDYLFSSTGSEWQKDSEKQNNKTVFCDFEWTGFCHSEWNEEYKASIKNQSFQLPPKSLYILNNSKKHILADRFNQIQEQFLNDL